MTRRQLLSTVATAGAAIVAGIVGVPALVASLSPTLARHRHPRWRRVGAKEDFPVGEIRRAVVTEEKESWPWTMQQQAVFVWRSQPDEFVVLSRSCTDLACPLDFDSGSECFFCPCHGGVFAKDGSVMAGPPSRPMDRFEFRLRNGVLEIDLASLKLGT
jgi:menaquinol-cytochrome c reductase iron-sulfur subunit